MTTAAMATSASAPSASARVTTGLDLGTRAGKRVAAAVSSNPLDSGGYPYRRRIQWPQEWRRRPRSPSVRPTGSPMTGALSRIGRNWRALSSEQRLAAIAAFALLLLQAPVWYHETGNALVGKSLQSIDDSSSAFGVYSFVEVAAIFVVVAGVLVLLWARAERKAFHLPGGDMHRDHNGSRRTSPTTAPTRRRPLTLLRVCNGPGCLRLIPATKRRCAACDRAESTRRRRKPSGQIYQSSKWCGPNGTRNACSNATTTPANSADWPQPTSRPSPDVVPRADETRRPEKTAGASRGC